jgi:polysaccharide export outer membrane protein
MKIRQNFIAVVVLTTILSGCETVEYPPAGERISPSTPVRLSPGDVIKVSFSETPELDVTQKIKIDGKVNLPLVGEVKASGKTVVGFQRDLAGLYAPQLEENEVLVTLENGIANVIVSGQVGRPGGLTFDRPTTVLQAIMEAGGATAYGNLSKVRLIRTVNGRQETGILNLRLAISHRTTEGTYVKDGDLIYVPQRLF